VNNAAQTSHAKIHKVPIMELRKIPAPEAQTSHFHDANRTSSLFGLFSSVWEGSGQASPLRCRAASSLPTPFRTHGRGFPPSKPSPLGNAFTLGRWSVRLRVRTLARYLGLSESRQECLRATRMHKSQATNRTITGMRFGEKTTVGRQEMVA
jgi:hypothetical protein